MASSEADTSSKEKDEESEWGDFLANIWRRGGIGIGEQLLLETLSSAVTLETILFLKGKCFQISGFRIKLREVHGGWSKG